MNHKDPVMVHMSKGISVDECVSQKVDKYSDPVGVVVVDGEAEMIVKKRVDTATARGTAEPREGVVALKGSMRRDGRVKVRRKAEKGMLMRRKGREYGEEIAKVVENEISKPSC